MGATSLFSKFAKLLDRTTVDLPTLNTPLADALAAKADSSSLSYVALSGSYDDLIDVPSPSPGVSEVADLTDATTYAFPTLNTPLVNALAGKSSTSHNHAGVYDPAGSAAAAQAAAIQRANHTGAQAISTVTGLQTAIDGKSSTAHTHSNAEVNTAIAASPATSATAMGLGTGNTPTFAGLNTTGNVGIGTTSPSELLDVSSNTGASGGTANPTTIRISDTSNGSAWDTVNSFANLDFYSADASGSGAGVKTRVGAIAEFSTGAQIGLAFSTTYSTNGLSEKMRINASGNVGIGTTSPTGKLNIETASSQTALQAGDLGTLLSTSSASTSNTTHTTSPYLKMLGGIWNGSVNTDRGFMQQIVGVSGANYGYRLNIGSTDLASAMSIVGVSGNVGIGTTAPSDKLDVVGNINVVGSSARIGFNAGNMAVKDEGGYKLGFQTYNSTSGTITTKMVLDTNGNVGIGTTLATNGKLVIAESGTSVGSTIRLIGTNTSGSASQVSHITSYQPAGGAAEASALDFKVRGTDPYATPSTVMTLLGGGKVGIGTATPAEKLDVVGNIKASGVIKKGVLTVGTLPGSPTAGMSSYVTDSSQTLAAGIGTTLVAAGGGTEYFNPVHYNGTNWIIG